jgi:hypothetical protein
MCTRFWLASCLALTIVCGTSCLQEQGGETSQRPVEDAGAADSSTADDSAAASASDTSGKAESAELIPTTPIIPATPMGIPGQQQEDAQAEAETSGGDDAAKALAALRKEMNEEVAKWRKAVTTAKTDEARRELITANPNQIYARKFLELAERFPGTAAEVNALAMAVQGGRGEVKQQAMERLLAASEAKPDSPEARMALQTLTMRGSGEFQLAAMERLLEQAEQNPESDQALSQLAVLIRTRGPSAPKSRAILLVNAIIDKDVQSDQAIDALGLLAASDDDQARSSALEKLFQHHANHESFAGLLKGLASQISRSSHDFLIKVCEEGTGDVRANAVLTLAKFYDRRDLLAQFYKDAPEAQLASMDQTMLSYLQEERPMDETSRLEGWLENFESTDEALRKEADNLLFALQNLSVGKVAPEITANDLDGIEFNLSDYRGKVVFLDFWGDW